MMCQSSKQALLEGHTTVPETGMLTWYGVSRQGAIPSQPTRASGGLATARELRFRACERPPNRGRPRANQFGCRISDLPF